MYVLDNMSCIKEDDILSIHIGKERPKLKDVYHLVSRTWAPRWRELGIELGLDHHMIEIIECNHRNDCETCCNKLFIKWLDTNCGATWEMLINAMDGLSDGKCCLSPTCVCCVCMCVSVYVL